MFYVDICNKVQHGKKEDEPDYQEDESATSTYEIPKAAAALPFFFGVSIWSSTFTEGVVIILFSECKSDEEAGDEAALMTDIVRLPIEAEALVAKNEEDWEEQEPPSLPWSLSAHIAKVGKEVGHRESDETKASTTGTNTVWLGVEGDGQEYSSNLRDEVQERHSPEPNTIFNSTA